MKKAFILFMAAAALLFGWAGTVVAGEFMADFKQHTGWEDEESRDQAGKIYYKDGASRMEFVRDGRPVEMLIMNPKMKKAWVLNAEDKTYMEIRFAEKPWQTTGKDREGLKEKKLGRETVAGYACEKTVYSFEDEPGAQMTVWMSSKLGYPVKWERKNEDGISTFALSKIREARLKDSLFVLPEGYRDVADEEDEVAGANREEESEVARVVKDDAKDLASDAKGAAKDEVTGIVTDSVREGIRGLFRK
jgi:outer membrane lipoprotein-sorting protein